MGKANFGWGLLVALVACDVQVQPPVAYLPYPPAELVHFQRVVDALSQAKSRNDSLACDTLIGQLEDPRLAQTEPSLLVDGYRSYVSAHAMSNPVPIARMDAFTRHVNSNYLRNWVLLLRGSQALALKHVDTALSLYTRALPGFLEKADTLGILTCTYKMGTLQLYRLDQPREFIRSWYVRERFSFDTLDMFLNAAQMGTAYRNLGLTDSARMQLAIMDRLRPAVERRDPGNLTNKVYNDDLLFTILCTEATRSKEVDMVELRKLFQDEVVLVEDNYLKYNWNPITVRIDYANALIANGLGQEAESVLKGGVRILADCENCKYRAIELYQSIAGILKERKDLAGAFHYQELYIRAKQESGMETQRTKAEQALASLRYEQQRDSLIWVNQREQAAADAAVSRGKAQRDLLLLGGALAMVIVALLWNRTHLRRRLQVERLRTRLSRDLHDDIGSTLSSINILSSIAQKRVQASGDPDAASALLKISARSQRLMRDMSDIVWGMDPQKDALDELLARMREFSLSLFESRGIAYSFDLPVLIPSLSLPAETRNNLYLFFKEAVNNAAKHSQASQVQVTIRLERNMLRLMVKDDGTGMDISAPRANGQGGNGLRNMRGRAIEMKAELRIVSAPGKGTEIILEVPLHG